MIDRERELIRQYDDAHRAYLEALEVVRARVFGRAEAVGRGAPTRAGVRPKSQVTRTKHRLADAERELQAYWMTEAVAQEVSR